MSNEQMKELKEEVEGQRRRLLRLCDTEAKNKTFEKINKQLTEQISVLKEELEESEKEKGQMAGNGGFCGDPETGQSANAMFWRMGRDRMKSLEEENKKLKKENEKLKE